MKLYPTIGLLNLLLLISQLTTAQSVEIIHGIEFGQSVESVKNSLHSHIADFELISPEVVVFPLAEKSETHLVVDKLKVSDQYLEKAVFTFADDRLVYVQTRGNVENALTAKRLDTAMEFMGYQVYRDDLVFIQAEKDLAWLLSPESVHPNLFTWNNPYLDGKDQNQLAYKASAKVPSWLEMGASLEQIRASLETHSDLINEEELDGSDPNAQLQINAFGVEYAGFPRKIEARFGDGKLNVVWILTGKGEEDRIRKSLTKAYGPPIEVMEDWEVFDNWTVLLRKDKPEVLLLTPELGQFYKKDFFNK